MAKCRLKYEWTPQLKSGIYYSISPQKAGWFIRHRGGDPAKFAEAKDRACRRAAATVDLGRHGGAAILITRTRATRAR